MAKKSSTTSGKTRSAGRVKVKMIGSVIGCPDKQRATVRGLGLRKLNSEYTLEDTPAVRGMINKVSYLVKVL